MKDSGSGWKVDDISRRYLQDFTDMILHGSLEHKIWLKEAVSMYIRCGRVPEGKQ